MTGMSMIKQREFNTITARFNRDDGQRTILWLLVLTTLHLMPVCYEIKNTCEHLCEKR